MKCYKIRVVLDATKCTTDIIVAKINLNVWVYTDSFGRSTHHHHGLIGDQYDGFVVAAEMARQGHGALCLLTLLSCVSRESALRASKY